MKCDKYKKLINRLVDGKLSTYESEHLLKHTKDCKTCEQEYSTALNYRSISNSLKKAKPVFNDKVEFINSIVNELPDAEKTVKSAKIIKHGFTNSKFRRVMASAAAALILFFIVQQTDDAWQIKQLETKIATKQFDVDYEEIHEQSFLKIIDEKENKTQLFLSKYKSLLLRKTLTRINYKKNYTQLHLNKTFLK